MDLSSTFADNVGPDNTQVFSGPFQTAVTFTGDPTNFEVVINFTTPFYYDPTKGNLLLDIATRKAARKFHRSIRSSTAHWRPAIRFRAFTIMAMSLPRPRAKAGAWTKMTLTD